MTGTKHEPAARGARPLGNELVDDVDALFDAMQEPSRKSPALADAPGHPVDDDEPPPALDVRPPELDGDDDEVEVDPSAIEEVDLARVPVLVPPVPPPPRARETPAPAARETQAPAVAQAPATPATPTSRARPSEPDLVALSGKPRDEVGLEAGPMVRPVTIAPVRPRRAGVHAALLVAIAILLASNGYLLYRYNQAQKSAAVPTEPASAPASETKAPREEPPLPPAPGPTPVPPPAPATPAVVPDPPPTPAAAPPAVEQPEEVDVPDDPVGSPAGSDAARPKPRPKKKTTAPMEAKPDEAPEAPRSEKASEEAPSADEPKPVQPFGVE